jgi:ribosome-associated protein
MEIKTIDIAEKSILADHFVICTGTSSTHIRALADELEYKMRHEFGTEPRSIEGRSSGWILLDYNDIVVHIFTKDQREFYNLEKLWGSKQ